MYSKTSFHRHVRGMLPEFHENPNDSSNFNTYLRPNNSRHTSKWVGLFLVQMRRAKREKNWTWAILVFNDHFVWDSRLNSRVCFYLSPPDLRGGGYEKHLKANVRINFGVDRNGFAPESGCLKNVSNIASGNRSVIKADHVRGFRDRGQKSVQYGIDQERERQGLTDHPNAASHPREGKGLAGRARLVREVTTHIGDISKSSAQSWAKIALSFLDCTCTALRNAITNYEII